MAEDMMYDLVQTESGMFKKVLKPEFKKRKLPPSDTLKVIQTMGALLGKMYDVLGPQAKKKFTEEEVELFKFFSEGAQENKEILMEIMKK